MEGGGIRKAAWMEGEGGGGRSRSRREKEGRRKWAMTCSVISVLCIRPRLIYREPRRGTGCAPGAHPGPSHASALPPILFRPLRPSSDFTSSLRFFFAPVFSPLIPTGWRKRALHFLFFLSRSSLSLSPSFQACLLDLLSASLFVYLILNGAFEVNIVLP